MTVLRVCHILLLFSFFLPFAKCTCFHKKTAPAEVLTTDSVAVAIPEPEHVDALSTNIEIDTSQTSAQDSVLLEINPMEEEHIQTIETAFNKVFEVLKVILLPTYYPESMSALYPTYCFLYGIFLDKLDSDALFYQVGLMLGFFMVVVSVILSFTTWYAWIRVLILVGFVCYLFGAYFLYREPCFELVYGFWITTVLFMVSALSAVGHALIGFVHRKRDP